jgi:hypothetical protein
MSAGKVEIGCFRTFSEAHVAKIESQGSRQASGLSVPIEKIEELGAHSHKYY